MRATTGRAEPGCQTTLQRMDGIGETYDDMLTSLYDFMSASQQDCKIL